MKNRIEQFWHCRQCIEELPEGVTPRDFIHVEVGFTEAGIQVWCVRHEENIIHLDFLGQKVAYFNEPTDEVITNTTEEN
jgi:hypothetical protein